MTGIDWQAVTLTLRLASLTTLLLIVPAVPLAWWISRGGGWTRLTVQALAGLPLVLPPTVIGFYLLLAMGPLTAPGRLLLRIVGHPLAFSFAGLLLGSMVYSLPFAVQPLVAGFRAVDHEVLEAAALLGASPLRRLASIALPLARGSVVTAALLCFTHTVGEFGVVLMLGGNIPGVTRTLSIALYNQVEDGAYADANRTALLLTGFALLMLIGVYASASGALFTRRPARAA